MFHVLVYVLFQHHPDKDPSDPHLHDKFVAINEAYSVLSKATSRREYDLNLNTDAYRKSYTANEAGSVPIPSL